MQRSIAQVAGSEDLLLEGQGLRTDGLGPIDLTLRRGERVFVRGASGAGKTRLLRLLADLDPHEGRLLLEGREATEWAPHEWRRRVGLLAAEVPWWHEYVGDHFPANWQPPLAHLGLPAEAGSWRITRLSSGEKQRLGLLRLLANRPQVLLLDEPTANLDAENVQRVEALLRRYLARSHAAWLWVSHDRSQAERLATRQLTLNDGRLVEGNPP